MGANTGEQTVAANGNGWAANQPTVALVLQHRLGWWQIFNAQARGTSCSSLRFAWSLQCWEGWAAPAGCQR